ncbi:hypothetical protein, partial [Pseudodesulfovibrio pelocollis]|uniref:hypothetical protein n=1 Tax=Pseudodesulfovibrio pelocollis TaxID=3051432 RepID=UPI00255AA8AE
ECLSKNVPPSGRKGKLLIWLTLVNTFFNFSIESGVDPAVRQEGELRAFHSPPSTPFSTFFSSSPARTPPSGRKGNLVAWLAPVNTFFNFFRAEFPGVNHSICLRKNKPPQASFRALPCGEVEF